jgi:hypothetical protein
VTPGKRDDATKFCDVYIARSEPYFTQVENTTQFKADGTRKYCGGTNGPLHSTAKQEETIRRVLSTPCSGTWSNFKAKWCECGIRPFNDNWEGKDIKATDAPQADHSCVNIRSIVEFIVECINADLVDEISTELIFTALAH